MLTQNGLYDAVNEFDPILRHQPWLTDAERAERVLDRIQDVLSTEDEVATECQKFSDEAVADDRVRIRDQLLAIIENTDPDEPADYAKLVKLLLNFADNL